MEIWNYPPYHKKTTVFLVSEDSDLVLPKLKHIKEIQLVLEADNALRQLEDDNAATLPSTKAAVPSPNTTTTTSTISTALQSTSSPICVTGHENIPLTTLKEILEFTQSTFKFRTHVKVVGHWPQDIAEFTRPFCFDCNKCVRKTYKETQLICPNCGENDKHKCEFVYMLSLFVKDSTGSLSLIVFNEPEFFHGIPPTDLRKNNISLKAINTKMERLLSNSQFICCIKSYYTSKDNTKERRYRIFDTTIL